jgi:hypothetical protein
MTVKNIGRCLIVSMAALALSRCGSSPTAPSGSGAKLQGVVLQEGTAAAASDLSAQSAKGGKIVVTVQENPSLTATVSGNGTFEIQDVPAGGFTLAFSVNGAPVGQIWINPVGEGSTIKIVVKVKDRDVELVEIETENEGGNDEGDDNDSGGDQPKTCMISGGKVGQGIELEGNVDSGDSSAFMMRINGNRSSGLVSVAAAGSSYVCNGKKGATDCKSSLVKGAKVHVRGNLTSCDMTLASVTATEVKIQK